MNLKKFVCTVVGHSYEFTKHVVLEWDTSSGPALINPIHPIQCDEMKCSICGNEIVKIPNIKPKRLSKKGFKKRYGFDRPSGKVFNS